MDKKYLLYGGVALAALAVGYVVYNSVGSSGGSASAQPDLSSAMAPIVYASGTGVEPLDQSGIAGAGQSSLDYLSNILDFQKTQEGDNFALANRSLDIQSLIGQKSIDASTTLATQNTNAASAATLANLGASLSQALLAGKGVAALTGSISGGGQTVNYTAENVSNKSKYNVALQGIGSTGITLANGQVIKG